MKTLLVIIAMSFGMQALAMGTGAPVARPHVLCRQTCENLYGHTPLFLMDQPCWVGFYEDLNSSRFNKCKRQCVFMRKFAELEALKQAGISPK